VAPIITADDVGKLYHRRHPNRPRTVHEALLRGLRGLRATESFWGLRHVSFTVAPGRMLGVLGRNGAGKSTLLRLLGGVDVPGEGRVEVRGHVGGLLTLGAGFHPDLTGRENVFVSGIVHGLTRAEVAERFDSILGFAELEDFIDSPLRIYSTGMAMRLGFAVASHMQPEVLLIDEVLAVGDVEFQRKCIDRIDSLKAGGCTIVLISHNLGTIRRLCDEAIWLDAGRLIAHGAAAAVVDQYVRDTGSATPVRSGRIPSG
jgi:lipopolysaccharide transport system ATP-binding protein